MKHWQEARQVFDWLATLLAEHRPVALATVVSVRGSAYRREGAKMAVAQDGASVGNVSGGCLEMDVREIALGVIASGVPELRSYCSATDDIRAWDLGVGCEGEVQVLIEPVLPSFRIDPTLFATATPFAVCTAADIARGDLPRHRLVVTAAGCEPASDTPAFDQAIMAEARRMLAQGACPALRDIAGRAVFVDVHRPPPQLVIVSAANDARPLARFADAVGFRTIVVDRRPGLLSPDRFPGATRLVDAAPADLTGSIAVDANSYAVVMTHNYSDDQQYLRALVATPVSYIGVLGPRQRTERLVRSIAIDTPFDTDRIYGPVGLDVGADGAEQIALAVVAELLVVRRGRYPRSLRERELPMHVPVDA
ncbi:MAG: XdhC family protein [Gemmatimonadales bacterium]